MALVPALAMALALVGPPPAGAGDAAKTGPSGAPPAPAARERSTRAPSSPTAPSRAPADATTPPPRRPSALPPPPPETVAPGQLADPPEPERPRMDLSRSWSRSKGTRGSPRFVRAAEERVETPNPEGYYSGVSVEGNHVPPFPATKMGAKPALLTWTGFERTSGGSRVFFEVSAAVATKLTVKGSTLTLRIANTKVNVKNNTRDLDLRYFKTPVRSVKVKRQGKDAVATIVLKRGAAPEVALVDGKAGYKLVVLEFADEAADAPAAR
jgi:hypothetical protein